MKIIIPSLKNNLCILSLLISFQVLTLNCSTTAQSRVHSERLSNLHATKSGETLSEAQICKIAKSTTVLILSEEDRAQGTGFLIEKKRSRNGKGFVYKLATNSHVLTQAKLYNIETSDGKVHKASELFRFGTTIDGKDLTTLQFESTKEYEIAKLAHGKELSSEIVIAAGYPLITGTGKFRPQRPELTCNSGTVSFVLDKPMRGGYQIGNDVDIRKGMSGGPLFNLQGQVVGINGRHKNPPFGGRNLYRYENGTFVDKPLEELKELSWAIPMEEFVTRAMSKGICLAYDDMEEIPDCKKGKEPIVANNTSANPNKSESQATTLPLDPSNRSATRNGETPGNYGAGSERSDLKDNELRQLAQEITVEVRIRKVSRGTTNSIFSRSGFVVDRKPYQEGIVYNVVTYVEQKSETKDILYLYHVVGRRGNKIPIVGNVMEIVTSNGDKLVQIQFIDRQDQYYKTATFGTFDLNIGDKVFASGCKTETRQQSEKDQATTECELTKGTVESIDNSNGSQIYLSDSMKITEEMLGGPLINSKGEVIGINSNQSHHDWGEEASSNNNFRGSAISTQELQEYLPRATFSNRRRNLESLDN